MCRPSFRSGVSSDVVGTLVSVRTDQAQTGDGVEAKRESIRQELVGCFSAMTSQQSDELAAVLELVVSLEGAGDERIDRAFAEIGGASFVEFAEDLAKLDPPRIDEEEDSFFCKLQLRRQVKRQLGRRARFQPLRPHTPAARLFRALVSREQTSLARARHPHRHAARRTGRRQSRRSGRRARAPSARKPSDDSDLTRPADGRASRPRWRLVVAFPARGGRPSSR
jgi:hypothetical protein